MQIFRDTITLPNFIMAQCNGSVKRAITDVTNFRHAMVACYFATIMVAMYANDTALYHSRRQAN